MVLEFIKNKIFIIININKNWRTTNLSFKCKTTQHNARTNVWKYITT